MKKRRRWRFWIDCKGPGVADRLTMDVRADSIGKAQLKVLHRALRRYPKATFSIDKWEKLG